MSSGLGPSPTSSSSESNGAAGTPASAILPPLSPYDHEARSIPFESSDHSYHWNIADAMTRATKGNSSGHSLGRPRSNTSSGNPLTSSCKSLSKPASKPSSSKSTETLPYTNPPSQSYTMPEAAFARVGNEGSSASHFLNSIVAAAQNAASSLAALKPDTKTIRHQRSTSLGSSFFEAQDQSSSETNEEEEDREEHEERLEQGKMQSSKAADVVIEPIRSTISTLGQGELSLASLGLDDGNTDANTAASTTSPSRAKSVRRKGAAEQQQQHGIPNISSTPRNITEETSNSEFDLPTFIHRKYPAENDVSSVHTGTTGSRRKRFAKHRNGDQTLRDTPTSRNATVTSTANDEDSSAGESARSVKNAITGYAYADKKRNKEFHRLFRSVMPDDYLLDDFSCALSREILIQGRLYVSERHVCFNSNILGWVTNLVIGFDEIVTMEKKNTAGLFPNGIVIQTLHARHSFASFVSRDTVMELMTTVWKQTGPYHPRTKTVSTNGTNEYDDTDEDPDDGGSGEDIDETEEDERDLDTESLSEFETSSEDDSEEGFGESARKAKSPTENKSSEQSPRANGVTANENPADTSIWPVANLGPETHAPTDLPAPDGAGEKVIAMETVPAPLGVVANLIFGDDSTWYKNFLIDVEKNTQLEEIPAFSPGEGGKKSRKYEYVKPLHGPVGPKQTKCICTDVADIWDMENCIVVITSTSTPDVPSGGSFVAKTRTGLCWAENNETKIVLSYWLEWSAKSWIKSAVEKGASDGQITMAKDLVAELNSTVKATRGKKAPGKKKPVLKKKSRKRVAKVKEKELEEAVITIWQKAGKLFYWHPIPMLGVPLWAYVMILLVIYSSLSPFIMQSDSSERQKELLRLKEEYEMWKWIDDRIARSGPVNRGESDELLRVRLDSSEKGSPPRTFNYRAHNVQDITEAIRITEHRIKLLKDKLELA